VGAGLGCDFFQPGRDLSSVGGEGVVSGAHRATGYERNEKAPPLLLNYVPTRGAPPNIPFSSPVRLSLSAVEQCFFLIANQPQPTYKKKKVCRTGPMTPKDSSLISRRYFFPRQPRLCSLSYYFALTGHQRKPNFSISGQRFSFSYPSRKRRKLLSRFSGLASKQDDLDTA
jgi:hypothetical protein